MTPPILQLLPPRYRITEVIHELLELKREPFGFNSPPVDQLSFENGNWVNIYADRIECMCPSTGQWCHPSEVISLSDPDMLLKIARWNETPSLIPIGNPVWMYNHP